MSIIEHVVLFKVKEDVAPSEADTMVERINSLASLEQLLHLTVGPLFRIRTSPPSLKFTHFFHTRFNSMDDLRSYVAHPAHVAVVKANTPLVDDAMALDWLAEVPGGTVPPPGSALRVTFFKLKEGVEDRVKDEIVGAMRGFQREFKQAIQLTCGGNFSPARAKGFSIASLEVFPGLSELEAAKELGDYHKNEKIKEHLESVMVLDYVHALYGMRLLHKIIMTAKFGNSRWVHAMEWSGQKEFATSLEVPFVVDGSEAGLLKRYGPLTFLKVHDAGHMVPMDQPKTALEMLKK
ncbi:Stress-response A/B barrel domain-containing protein UP3 [Glycine soja]|uniref:Stress-response A/B barrel domain-containing protein UP3 n=1 Tax=Glycine soja TaxID=3848 RepID=A0A445HE89_GLYSO|nr:Stress-response A/B barrel domain-containing protein UP3 [Glycine soja]